MEYNELFVKIHDITNSIKDLFGLLLLEQQIFTTAGKLTFNKSNFKVKRVQCYKQIYIVFSL